MSIVLLVRILGINTNTDTDTNTEPVALRDT